ncbi:MAG: transcription-repair coupling factor [Bacteroidetes bacterium]|nr:transcription-repair coupling factor [Bacteroidota bacterium]
MDIENFYKLIYSHENFGTIENWFRDKGKNFRIAGMAGAQVPLLATSIHKKAGGSHLFILNDKTDAIFFENDLEGFLEKKEILMLTDSFKKTGRFEEISNSNIQLRAETLNKLINPIEKTSIIVTYPQALMEKVVSVKKLAENIIRLKVGEKVDVDFMLELLVDYGFHREDFVYEPGEFSIRGGIIDIYSFGNALPYRVELLGDEVESLRTFDVETQLSDKRIRELTIIPNINEQFERTSYSDIFEFLPKNLTIWIEDPAMCREIMEQYAESSLAEFERLQSVEVDRHPFENKNWNDFLVTTETIVNRIAKKRIIVFGSKKEVEDYETVTYQSKPQTDFNRNFELLIDNLKSNTEQGITNYIFTDNPRQIERFNHIFEDLNANVEFTPLYQALSKGFIDPLSKIACYTDHEIFQRFHKYKAHQGYSRSKAMTVKALRDLQPGDFITHLDHGVGVFSGLERVEISGQAQEMVRIKYKDNDLLYVNINSLHKISKFTGKEGKAPRVNKLGSDSWQNLKRKTKRKIKDIAKELIALYAKRKAESGFAFSEDSYMQLELEASFIYEDTPDQYKATQDVKADMEKPMPMDRLVCGDVGFGKTEVAIRSAFKAVADSKQVGILVPTTILALQHYKTFSERLRDFPVKVDYINRFKTTKEKNASLKELAEGKIDIMIGTHAILGKKVLFKDLGLLVIDEEQKFGVSAKEKLRKVATNVDTLTLTATPIPRTLKFSLLGARDMSIIQTAPPNRQPVTTEVHPFDPELIKEAIEYEVYRGGQVFFIHNRVKDIANLEVMLKKMMPGIGITQAHGQMEGKALEGKMLDFIEGRFDVLLCTNIVESGLDIPNANTIIINNAHHFGLSDLHQLRGRVGRSNKKAFCYLLAPPMSTLTTDARRRLKTLEEFSDLGSGFNISMRDLDIRGAGNLLGGEQSGFIADIGFEMYHKILDETIQELKFTEFKDLFKEELEKKTVYISDCQIDTDIEMLIPREYVHSGEERLKLYTELDDIPDEAALEKYKEKLVDRFGPLPPSVNELFNGLRLRWLALQLGFERLILKKRQLKCYFIQNQESPFYDSPIFGLIMSFVQAQGNRCTLKQSVNHLILIFPDVQNMTRARAIFNELLDAISKPESN